MPVIRTDPPQRLDQAIHRLRHVDIGDDHVGDPQRQAVDEDSVVRPRRFGQGAAQFERLFDGGEGAAALLLVGADPLAQFVVERFGGGEIGRALARAHGEPLGEPGFA